MRYEATNVVYQSLKTRNITLATANALIDALVILPIAVYHDEFLHQAALTTASRFRIGAAYDAHYVALAQHLGAELWTADKRLYNAIHHQLDFVRLVE
jgi:predicted nucleic acid-binding protein